MQPFTKQLEDLYELGEEIGNGQSAVVRRVVERASGRSFAAKLVRRRRGAAAQAEARREASALGALRHPNLVALHETFETSLHTVFIIELVHGGELQAVLETHGGSLKEKDSADVVRQILQGLEHMHTRGIAHLDLKPENVMLSTLTPPWKVKLIDFGLSREVAGGDERALQGTPEFLAPEAVNFEPLSLATDIWAVGVITYLLLSGISPFMGEDKQATFCNIVAGEYDTERLTRASVLAPALVARMLVHNPRKRPTADTCLADAWLAQEIDSNVIDEVTEVKCNHKARKRWRTLVQVISVARHLSLRSSETSSESSTGTAVSSDQPSPAELICDSLTSSVSTDSPVTSDVIYLQHMIVDNLNTCGPNNTAETELNNLGPNLKSISSYQRTTEDDQNRAFPFISNGFSTENGALPHNNVIWNQHVNFKINKESEDLQEEKENSAILAASNAEMTGKYLRTSDILAGVPDNSEEGAALNTTISENNDVQQRLSAALANGQLETTDSRGETPMFWAARQGNVEAVRLLAASGARIGAQNKLGETCLHVACRYGHASVVGALCLLPLDLDHRENEGETPLHAASSRGHVECVRRLVDAGASLDIQDKRYGATPLMMALRRNQSRVALLLLHAGADLELADVNGDTPLHVAAQEGLLAAAQTLCAYGCRVDIANGTGLMPIHVAARRGHTELVRSVMLHVFIDESVIHFLHRCLCLAGCDVDRRNSDGIKAEITALKHGHHEIAELLARLTNVRQRDEYIRQLVPGTSSLTRLTIKVVGHSGVGKTALLDSLGAGLFASLFKRSRGPTAVNVSRSHPTSPSKTHIEMDVTAKSKDELPSFDSRNAQGGTRGIDVRLLSVAGVGEVVAWEFSGQEAYFPVYHHFLGINATSSVYLLVCSLEDSPPVRLQQCLFWLSFMKARIAPTEPFGIGGSPRYAVHVILIATHADSVRCPRALQAGGEYVCTEVEWLLEQLSAHAQPALRMHSRAIVLDAHVPGAPGMRALKASLVEVRQQSLQVRPRCSGLLDATMRWLPNWKRVHASFPVLHWPELAQLVRMHINPLASEEHLRELLHQLIFLGEVIFLRNSGLVVMCPRWLGVELLGHLLSAEFLATARATGCYTCDDFQSSFPAAAEARHVLHVLEALDLCVQCEIDGEIEYEFPCFNFVETLDGLWDPEDPRYADAVYAGVRIRSATATPLQLAWLFPRLQIQLRRAAQSVSSAEPDTDLYQWLHGSKLCTGLLESLVTLDKQGDIEVKVRGPALMRLACFYFLEDIITVVDQVIEAMLPGLPPERRVLSSEQLRFHVHQATSWPLEDVTKAVLSSSNCDLRTCLLKNTMTGKEETLFDLLAFGASEAMSVLVLGPELPVTSLGSVARQELCRALDPPEPLGRDWCLLAVSLGLGERIAVLECGTSCSETPKPSPTARLLEEWSRTVKTATIGVLIARLHELGREDVTEKLLHLAPAYRVLPSTDYWSEEVDEDGIMCDTSSSNLSR